MQILPNDNVVYFDIDSTLVFSDKPPGLSSREIVMTKDGFNLVVHTHEEHIKRLMEFKGRGQSVVVWSQGGYDWARRVVETLGLYEYVDLVLSKPKWFFDDQPATRWLGEDKRTYVEPNNENW